MLPPDVNVPALLQLPPMVMSSALALSVPLVIVKLPVASKASCKLPAAAYAIESNVVEVASSCGDGLAC